MLGDTVRAYRGRINVLLTAAALLALSNLGAKAQTSATVPPSIRQQGEQQERRQQERDEVQRERLQRAPDVSTLSPMDAEMPWPEHEFPCAEIKEVALAGDDSAAFHWTIDDLASGSDAAVGRCLGVAGMNVAASRAQRVLIARGFVTSRVLLSAQDVSSGRLTLTLQPGRIRSVRFADGTDVRATSFSAMPSKAGEILNLRDIEQGLENFKRLPTAQADVQIAPADQPGQSDLIISWQQPFPFRLTAAVDDSGTKSTGRYQGNLTFSYDNWWLLHDMFYVSLNQDLGGGDSGNRGTRGYNVHYSLPWGYALLAFNAGNSRYHQSIAGLTENYVYSGQSEYADVKLSRVIYRDATRKTSMSIKGWMRRSANFIDDTEVLTQRRATGGWEAGFAHKESIGRATLEANVAHRRGTAAFSAQAAPEEAFGEGTSRMQLTTADINLSAPFTLSGQRFRYQATWHGQWNRTPLTPQDRLAVGGRYTVRGFDGESSLSAERGWFLRNDLGITLGDSGQEAYFGLDYGQVRGPVSKWLAGKHLAGAVIGLRGGYEKLSYDFFIGQPISKPKNFLTAATTAGFSLFLSF